MKQDPRRLLAPILSRVRDKRARARFALEKMILSEVTPHEDRTAVRAFLAELRYLERARPDTTQVTVMRDADCAWIWAYEPELAPAGHGPSIRVRWSQHLGGLR